MGGMIKKKERNDNLNFLKLLFSSKQFLVFCALIDIFGFKTFTKFTKYESSKIDNTIQEVVKSN